MVGARSFAGNPWDGHTLAEQLEQSTILLEDIGVKPKQVVVDLGYRGKDVDAANPGIQIIHRGRYKSMDKHERKLLKRRQAVEPAIGHLKADHRMNHCWLKGAIGDALHALSCAVGYNLRTADAGSGASGLEGPFAGLRSGALGGGVNRSPRRERAKGRSHRACARLSPPWHVAGRVRNEFCRADYVSFEIEIVGNFEEKSFAFSAIATATLRAIDL